MYVCDPQIKLLRVLGHLGTSDKQASDNMYAVVADSMRRGNTGHTIGNAIVYEAVRTIASIYPNPSLLQSGIISCSQQLAGLIHKFTDSPMKHIPIYFAKFQAA